jgi:hypothetical protein
MPMQSMIKSQRRKKNWKEGKIVHVNKIDDSGKVYKVRSDFSFGGTRFGMGCRLKE